MEAKVEVPALTTAVEVVAQVEALEVEGHEAAVVEVIHRLHLHRHPQG